MNPGYYYGLNSKKEGECIFKSEDSKTRSHLIGVKGIAKVDEKNRDNLLFKPNKGKDKFGDNNFYIVEEKDLEYIIKW